MQPCSYCEEKKEQIKKYEEEMEKEKVAECLKALEREKIARGLQRTKEEELRLREMQKMQMYEKKCLDKEEEDRDNMWHQILLEDVRRKEEYERLQEQKRQQDMMDRRKAYDEQIASANKKRRDALREEREKERRRLEKMREKIDQDHYEAIKRKRDQQMTNKTNFIEGHEMKLTRLRMEKMKEREIDNNNIRVALEELRKERIRKRDEMLNLRMEKEIFSENFKRERKNAEELEEEADRCAQEWKQQEENKTDEFLRAVENERKINKERATQQYQKHLEELKGEIERERQERKERMARVSINAYKELQRKMDKANEELQKQIEFRNTLKNQIRENQKSLESEINEIDSKDWTFTKKSEMFSDVMLKRYKQFPGRQSTNPVHPFKRIMDTEEAKKPSLHLPPLIGNKYK